MTEYPVWIPNSNWFKQRKRINSLVSMENHDWASSRGSKFVHNWFLLTLFPWSMFPFGSKMALKQELVAPSQLQGYGKEVVLKGPKGYSIGLGGVTWPPTNQSLWSGDACTDWPKPRSHAPVTEPGSEIIVQGRRELVLPKQQQKQGNGCWMGGGKAVHCSCVQLTNEEAAAQRWEVVCSKWYR